MEAVNTLSFNVNVPPSSTVTKPPLPVELSNGMKFPEMNSYKLGELDIFFPNLKNALLTIC